MNEFDDLQLLPTQKKKLSLKGLYGGNTFLGVAAVIFIGLLAAYGILIGLTKSTMGKIEKIDNQLAVLNKARNKSEETKLADFNKQLNDLKGMLTNHIVWAQGLRDTQKLIDPRVSFTTLSADATKHAYSFSAVADDFSAVARQIAAFYASGAITDVSLSKVGTGQNGRVEFSMDLIFKPEYFLLTKKK